MYKVELIVRPRQGVRDPQGEAVEEALMGLGYSGLKVEAVGRYLVLDIEAEGESQARTKIDEMCRQLLVNPNLETYELTLSKR